METINRLAHDYQKKAIRFGLVNKSVYYALDLGMGKTLVALALIRLTKQPAIVWAPLKPIYNTWPEEIEKWAPGLTYDIIHGPDKAYTLQHSTADVWLINYDAVKWFSENYMRLRPKWERRMLVLDESSMLKDSSRMRFKTLKKLRALWTDYKICLSATPAPNGYHELWPQYFMLDAGKLLEPTYGAYRSKYFIYSGPPIYKTVPKFGAGAAITRIIKPNTYRLEASDYLKMPDIIYNNVSVTLPPELILTYKKLKDEFLLRFDDRVASSTSAAAIGMKLRQFVQGALYIDDAKGGYEEIHTLKVEALKELLETSAGQPILCPVQFKFEVKMIHKYIDKDIPVIAGGVSNTTATDLIRSWNKGNLPLLLCHPASIGHGTNLQAGGHILLWYCLTWSLELYKQLNGRLYRQGQAHHSVTVNHLTVKGTIDEQVAKALSVKDATQNSLLTALKR